MKKQLASRVSTNAIDTYYEVAKQHGAYGGKISGAGGGGFLSVFASAADHNKIVDALKEFGIVPYKFNFETRGTAVTRFE